MTQFNQSSQINELFLISLSKLSKISSFSYFIIQHTTKNSAKLFKHNKLTFKIIKHNTGKNTNNKVIKTKVHKFI